MKDLTKTFEQIIRDIEIKISQSSSLNYIDNTKLKSFKVAFMDVYFKMVSTQEVQEFILSLPKCDRVHSEMDGLFKVPKENFCVRTFQNLNLRTSEEFYLIDINALEYFYVHSYFDDGCIMLSKFKDFTSNCNTQWVMTYIKSKNKIATSFKDLYFNY